MPSSAFSRQRPQQIVPNAAQITVVTASPGVPASGASDSVLTKNSGSDYDTAWLTRANLAADAAFTGAFVAQSPAWTTTFNPQVDQGVTTNIAHTVTKSQWHYDGDMVEFECNLSLTASGTAASGVTCTLPVAALSASNGSMGAGLFYDSSAGLAYICGVATATTTTVNLLPDQVAGGGAWGATPSLAVATGDQMRFLIRYRWR